MASNHQYKICFIGAGGTGKTSTAKYWLGCSEFEERYVPTIGAEVHPVEIQTRLGQGVGSQGPTLVFNIWDCAGQQCYLGLKDEHNYYDLADAAVFFHSLDEEEDKVALKDLAVFKKMNPNAHVIHVFAKSDLLTSPGVGANLVERSQQAHIHFCSSKIDFKMKTPFEALARNLLGHSANSTLTIVKQGRMPSVSDDPLPQARCTPPSSEQFSTMNSNKILEDAKTVKSGQMVEDNRFLMCIEKGTTDGKSTPVLWIGTHRGEEVRFRLDKKGLVAIRRMFAIGAAFCDLMEEDE